MREIFPIVVPKWGLEMQEGRLVAWLVEEGQAVHKGDELLEIETSKVTSTLESSHSGLLRRKVAELDRIYSCGTLIGVIADATASEEQIDAFISGYSIGAKQLDASAEGPAWQIENVSGTALRFLQQGHGGVPVLLIHGFGGDLNNWLLMQPALATDRATYAVDLPGHGGSSKDLSTINSFEDVADILLAFLDARHIEKTHLVAHSMGAPIALAMARRAHKRIETLSLLAPAGLGHAVRRDFIEGLIAARSRRQVSEALKFLFATPDHVSRELADDMLRFKRLDGVEVALEKYAGFLKRETLSLQEASHGITQPMTILWGVGDKVISPMAPDMMPMHVDLILLENTGHMPHTEQSAATVEVIRKIIERPL